MAIFWATDVQQSVQQNVVVRSTTRRYSIAPRPVPQIHIWHSATPDDIIVEYHVYAGEGHGWRKTETIEQFYQSVDRFLRQYVVFA